jgi:hypothetical protein
MFGKKVFEPVATIRTSYSTTRSLSQVTVLANRSSRTARSPAYRVTPFSRYQLIGLSTMSSSSAAASPASTCESMMRL